MNKVRTIFSNMSWMMISQIMASILAFFWTLITARYLGVSDFGIFGTAISFYAIFSVLNDLGISTYILRAISTDFNIEDEYLGVGLTLKFILTILFIVVTGIALLLTRWDPFIIIICLLFTLEDGIKGIYSFFYLPLQSHEQMKYQAISNIVLNIGTFIFIILVTFTNWGLWGIALAYIVANIIAGIYTFIVVKKNIYHPKIILNLELSKKFLKSGLPFAVTRVAYRIYYSIDMIMLTQFAGEYYTGLYNSSYKLISVLTLFYTIYTSVIYPVMSKLFKNEKNLLRLSFNKSIKYLSIITIPLSVATVFYAGDVITLIYGNQYADATNVLKILIWTVCFLFINGACSIVLEASHKEVSVTKIYSIAAIFNVGLNLILIPKYNVFGAAIATVISEILILCLEIYVLSKINQLPDRSLLLDILKISIASSLLGALWYSYHLNIWLTIPISIIIYMVLIIILKLIDQDDKIIINQLLGKKIFNNTN